MSKLLVVFGATGNQGGSVIRYVLNDAELSKEYQIRAITRDPSKETGQALEKQGVEVVKGDIEDRESIKKALQDAHTVFAITTTNYTTGSKDPEVNAGKSIADAAVAAGAQYIIWSSSQDVNAITGGKLASVSHFDAKNDVEKYIRDLPIKSSFFAPGSFYQNFHETMAPRPSQGGDGTYTIANVFNPDTPVPFIDIVDDTGKYVGAILAEPDKYEGKIFSAATTFYNFEEVARTMSKVTGKTVKYSQVPDEIFKGFLPPGFAQPLLEMLMFFRDFGYYGPNQKELVEWSAKQARDKPTTLEEWLEKNSFTLK